MSKQILKSFFSILGHYYPKQWISFRYFLRFKRLPNLSSPTTLNEKILFLSLRTNTSKWTLCADKYKVREYVSCRSCENTLVQLYGVYSNASEINYAALPDEFVIKTNHGCGGVIIVKDKSKLDIERTNKILNKALSRTYGDFEAGIHYTRIKPLIIIEQLLHETNNSTSLIDYKIWCFNGIPHFIFVISNRQGHHMDIMLYDTNWQPLPHFCNFNDNYRKASLIDRPQNLQEMLSIATCLATGFPQVRVDLYDINGKIYFGELTFTSLGGLMTYFSNSFQRIAGDMIDLSYPDTN